MALIPTDVGDNAFGPGSFAADYLPDQLIAGDFKLVTSSITVLHSAALLRGTVLGKITTGAAASAAKSGGNTGTGTLTLDATTPELAGIHAGVYKARCKQITSGTPAATGAPRTGNTGNATIGTVTPGATASLGEYRVVFTAATTFDVFNPAGALVAAGSTGAAFSSGGIGFTITAGVTPCAAGDEFVLIVTDTGVSVFSVTDPNGVALPDDQSGATYANQLKFVIAEGGTKFVVGDGFDITTGAASGKYLTSIATAIDGSQVPCAILVDNADASAGDVAAGAYLTGEFNGNKLIFDSSFSLAQIKAALRPFSIFVKTAVSAADPS